MKSNSRGMSISKLCPLFLFIVPLLFYWIYSLWINPSENYYTSDALFPYLINSLAPFKGGSYQYVDHPGTPVEVIGTLLLGLTYPFLANTPNQFVFHYLQNPGLFFTLANYFLVLAHLLCVLIFFFTARSSEKLENTLLAAALATMYFAIHSGSFQSSMIWNHNSFSFPFGTLLSLFLFKSLHRDVKSQNGLSLKILIILGLWAGFLASITIYLLAWLAGIMIAVGLYYFFTRVSFPKTIFALMAIGFSSLFGFFISIIPVLERMPIFFDWILKIFTHESKYLAVPENEPTFTRILTNWGMLWESLPALSIATIIVCFLVGIALFLQGKKVLEQPGLWALTLGLFAQTLLLLFILLDRPSRTYYFLSLAATLPVLTLATVKILKRNPVVYKTLLWGGSTVLLLGIINNTNLAIHAKQLEISSLVAAQARVASVIKEYSQATGVDPEKTVILWMHDTYSPCWGLRFGNGKAGQVFNEELDMICKNQYELTTNIRVILPTRTTILNEVNWDIIFTCKRWTDDLLEYNPNLVIQPQDGVDWACGNMVVVTKNKNP